MSDHNEHACATCGSLLHFADRCPQGFMNNVTTQGQAHQETGKPVGEWSDEQLRVRVAELCGWKRIEHEHDPASMWPGEIEVTTARTGLMMTPHNPMARRPPDYPNDLNAMHEAEKTLIFSKRQRYYEELRQLWANPSGWRPADIELCRSTAKERAIAFIQTLSPVSSDSTPNGISASIPNTGQKDQP